MNDKSVSLGLEKSIILLGFKEKLFLLDLNRIQVLPYSKAFNGVTHFFNN